VSLQALSGATDLLQHILRTRQQRPRQNIALPGEVDKLLASAPRWLQIIILLAHDAGLRRSDAMRFSLQNYDAETRSIRLIQKKTSEPLYVPADEISAEKTAEENHERSTRRPARTTAMQDLEARQIEREKKRGPTAASAARRQPKKPTAGKP
jgi:integrase